MTFDEARAQFPVLERTAYLNAGTNGPLARSTIEAFVEAAERDLHEGRSGKAYVDRMLELLGLTGEDEVITTDQEHFGLTGPLFATGARVVMVDGDEDAILGAVGARTRLIATSQVLWTTGRRLDLARVKRESGLPVLVDGAQSAGAIPVDVGELDWYTVSAQKWLCAP